MPCRCHCRCGHQVNSSTPRSSRHTRSHSCLLLGPDDFVALVAISSLDPVVDGQVANGSGVRVHSHVFGVAVAGVSVRNQLSDLVDLGRHVKSQVLTGRSCTPYLHRDGKRGGCGRCNGKSAKSLFYMAHWMAWRLTSHSKQCNHSMHRLHTTRAP